MRITEHFSREEFDCRDGSCYPEEWIESRLKPLCKALEKIRALTGHPLKVTSGYRTPKYNKAVGGAPNSFHKKGMAADLKSAGMTPTQLFRAIVNLMDQGEIPAGGVKKYPTFVHYDQRGKKTLFE